MSKRSVKRVLVMLDYGPEDSSSGEVFDLTALTAEMLRTSTYSASIDLRVEAHRTYVKELPVEVHISWGGYAGEFVFGATHLEDVVNSAMPDGERVSALKTKSKRLRKKAEQVDSDAMVAKLIQVSEVRSQHPIARVTETQTAALNEPDVGQDSPVS